MDIEDVLRYADAIIRGYITVAEKHIHEGNSEDFEMFLRLLRMFEQVVVNHQRILGPGIVPSLEEVMFSELIHQLRNI